MPHRSSRLAQSAKSSSSLPLKEQQLRRSHFPLLELPLELRRMVYRQILAPGGIDYHDNIYDVRWPVDFCIEGKWGGTEEQYAAAVQYDKERADFLVASKQINAEGSAVFYDDIHTAKVAIHRRMSMDTIRSGFIGVMTMPTYLPRLRRIDICLRYSRSSDSICSHKMTTGHFTRLCHELAAQCHALTHVVFVLSCGCSGQMPQFDGPVCPTAEEFEQLLKPLERVRVSRSLQLKSSCKLLERLQPVFDRSAAVVKSSDPVPELEGGELIWWQLMEKARPFFTNKDVRTSLYMAHEDAAVPLWMKLGPTYMEYPNPALTLEEDRVERTAFWKRSLLKFVEYVEQQIDEMVEKASRKQEP
ncbi:MAG: hypothetical protein Q9184_008476 [Pyrenodesmia sp. 2 TL-2023]